jgi:ferritin-like metal-binding protein YciE
MDKSRELFLHELGVVLAAEQMIAKMLSGVANEAWDAKLTAALEKHLTETEKHVKSVKDAYKAVGAKARAGKCPAIKGLRKEHDRFIAAQEPNRTALDIYLTASAIRAEHYEIAAYTSLTTLASALGETKAAGLLRKNLEQEVAMLGRLERIASRLAKKVPNAA